MEHMSQTSKQDRIVSSPLCRSTSNSLSFVDRAGELTCLDVIYAGRSIATVKVKSIALGPEVVA